MRAADASQETWELIAKMAAALGTGDAGEFLGACDPDMTGYAALRTNITALVAQWQVESAIDPIRNEGDDRAREVEVDWQLQLADRTGLDRVTRRRQSVKLRIEKQSRKWRVVAIEPAAFFTPSA